LPADDGGHLPVLEPSHTTEALLRAMAGLEFGTADRGGWHEEILAAAGQLGGPVALVAVVSHTSPERIAALRAIAEVADPALGWSPGAPARADLAAAGLVPLTAHLTPLEAVGAAEPGIALGAPR
ncbi:MAG: hypothetical protein LBK59_06140, partial [Bifidobacteriaceae bacterium]|nr:hypothetical protein [Bifidobacteriaceae bacterium]